MSDYQENSKQDKFWEKIWFLVVSMLFLAPLGAYFTYQQKIKNSDKLQRKTKQVLTYSLVGYCLLWTVMLVFSGSQQETTDVNEPTPILSLEQQDDEVVIDELEESRQEFGKSILIESGATSEQANVLADLAGEIELKPISSSVKLDGTQDSEVLFRVNNEDGVFIVNLLGAEVVEIVDQSGDVVYQDGKKNDQYIYSSDIDWIGLKVNSEEIVKQVLKAPSTADFAGSTWDPFDGWTRGKTGSTLTLEGYVDSENSFGAMIRSNYLVRYDASGATYSPTYFEFDGQVILNEE